MSRADELLVPLVELAGTGFRGISVREQGVELTSAWQNATEEAGPCEGLLAVFDGRPNQLVAQPTRVRVGETATVDAELVAGATVRGRVLDAAGAPVSGSVQVYNALTGDPASTYAFTDEQGHYELRGLAGQFVRIAFWAAYPDDRKFWYGNASGFHSATPMWVPAGGAKTCVDFTIPPA